MCVDRLIAPKPFPSLLCLEYDGIFRPSFLKQSLMIGVDVLLRVLDAMMPFRPLVKVGILVALIAAFWRERITSRQIYIWRFIGLFQFRYLGTLCQLLVRKI